MRDAPNRIRSDVVIAERDARDDRDCLRILCDADVVAKRINRAEARRVVSNNGDA